MYLSKTEPFSGKLNVCDKKSSSPQDSSAAVEGDYNKKYKHNTMFSICSQWFFFSFQPPG